MSQLAEFRPNLGWPIIYPIYPSWVFNETTQLNPRSSWSQIWLAHPWAGWSENGVYIKSYRIFKNGTAKDTAPADTGEDDCVFRVLIICK